MQSFVIIIINCNLEDTVTCNAQIEAD